MAPVLFAIELENIRMGHKQRPSLVNRGVIGWSRCTWFFRNFWSWTDVPKLLGLVHPLPAAGMSAIMANLIWLAYSIAVAATLDYR